MERGAYSKFWLRGEGLIREGDLIEKGLNSACTVNSLAFRHYLLFALLTKVTN